MALGLFYSLICLIIFLAILFRDKMGFFSAKNQFDVKGKTILLTGGSTGLGRELARQLAEKGANVIISARTEKNLIEAVAYIKQGASASQHISYIPGDISDPSFASNLVAEATSRNNGVPPEIVWCCAGITHPTLFMDTPPEIFSKMMNANYLGSVYSAQAAFKAWLPSGTEKTPSSAPGAPTRHLIFTTSIVALISIPGYAAYSPSKAATKSLADTLALEAVLYESTHAPIKVHTCFPATIFSAAYEDEQKIKCDLTKKLEEADGGQTPAVVARECIAGLERGDEYVTTAFLTRLVKAANLGPSLRNGWGFVDTVLAFVATIAMPFVRSDYEGQIRRWGKENGGSGTKKTTT